MISKNQINKNGINSYVFHFFKMEYKNYFLYSFLIGIPIVIAFILNDFNFTELILSEENSLNILFKNILPIVLAILYFASQVSFSVLYLKKTIHQQSIINLILNTLIYSIPISFIIGLGYIIFQVFKTINSNIPVLGFMHIVTFIGFIFFGLFYMYSILYINNINTSFKIFIYTLKTQTFNILNSITALLLAFVLPIYTMPNLVLLIDSSFRLILGINISNSLINHISMVLTYLTIYVTLHIITVRLYMICNGISEQYKLEKEGNNINQIGLTTDDENDDELL